MKIYSQLEEFHYSARHPLVRSGKWVVLTGLLLLLVSMLIWWPAFRADDSVQTEIAAKKRALVYVLQSDELIRLFRINEEAVPQLEEKLKQRVTQSQLMGTLNKLSRDNNIRIVSENYEEAQSESGSVITADMTVTGKYRNIKFFLRGISSLPIWAEFVEVRVEKPHGSDLLKSRIRISTYHDN